MAELCVPRYIKTLLGPPAWFDYAHHERGFLWAAHPELVEGLRPLPSFPRSLFHDY